MKRLLEELQEELERIRSTGLMIEESQLMRILEETARDCAQNAEEDSYRLRRAASMLSSESAMESIVECLINMANTKTREAEELSEIAREVRFITN